MALLAWRYARGDGVHLERVDLDEDGKITRLVTHPGASAAPEVGWWRGTFGESGLAAARSLARQAWGAPGLSPPPSLVGSWQVARPDGATLSLDASAAVTTDDLAPSLGAVLGSVIAAADQAASAVRLTARWGSIGDERLPLVDLAATGAGPVTVRVEAAGPSHGAAFLNDDGETVGFVGDDLELAPGSHVFALLRGWPVTDGGLGVAGTLRGGPAMAQGPGPVPLSAGGSDQVAFGAIVQLPA